MHEKLRASFDAVSKNNLISSVDVEAIVKSFGFPFARRTLQKWATLGVISPPTELNESLGNGRRTGYDYNALVKILALNLTLRSVTGLGKGSRIKRRFTTVALAIRYTEDQQYDLNKISNAFGVPFMRLASKVVSPGYELGKPLKYAKLIRLVAIVYCFCHNLIIEGEDYDAIKGVRTLDKAAIFDSTKDEIGIKESSLHLAPTTPAVIYGLETAVTNAETIAKSKVYAEFKAWAKIVRFFESNGWVADLGAAALKRKGVDSFVDNPKANWLVSVAVDV